MIRVLIADDQTLFRRALATILGAAEDLEVVGEASNGAEAVEQAAELVPDVVLMDVHMPILDGIAAAAQIRDATPASKVMMLTVSDDDADLFEALKAGAAGYLLKDSDPEAVADAVRGVAAGNAQLSPRLASKVLGGFTKLSQQPAVKGPILTAREMQVLERIVKGRTNRGIAKDLAIAENTVKNHIRNILEKLHVSSRTEAAVWAMREGLD